MPGLLSLQADLQNHQHESQFLYCYYNLHNIQVKKKKHPTNKKTQANSYPPLYLLWTITDPMYNAKKQRRKQIHIFLSARNKSLQVVLSQSIQTDYRTKRNTVKELYQSNKCYGIHRTKQANCQLSSGSYDVLNQYELFKQVRLQDKLT